MKYCLDANIFLAGSAGQRYQQEVFPSLWAAIAPLQTHIVLVKPIYDEIEPASSADMKKPDSEQKYPVRTWLLKHGFKATPLGQVEESISLELEKKYEYKEKSKGVSLADIALISYAKHCRYTLVTLEARQKDEPKEKYNYKIPLVCEKEGVKCINFVEFLIEFNITL